MRANPKCATFSIWELMGKLQSFKNPYSHERRLRTNLHIGVNFSMYTQ